MNLEDIKDKLKNDLTATWERLQESSIFNQLKDRYENLSPNAQRITVVATSLILSLLIISIPYGKFSLSSESVSEFESKRNLIRELHRVSREISEAPALNPPPGESEIKTSIEDLFKKAQLVSEQNAVVNIQNVSSQIISQTMISSGFVVEIKKLNLRQVIDIGYQLQALNAAVKLKDMSVQANLSDSKYMDVVYKLVSLKIPENLPPPPPPEIETSAKSKRNRNTTEE